MLRRIIASPTNRLSFLRNGGRAKRWSSNSMNKGTKVDDWNINAAAASSLLFSGGIYLLIDNANDKNLRPSSGSKEDLTRVELSPLEMLRHQSNNTAKCEEAEEKDDDYMLFQDYDYDINDEALDASGYTESERFYQCLEYHRQLLFDYKRRWSEEPDTHAPSWPRNIPEKHQIPALEMDYNFCRKSPSFRNYQKRCQNLQFRIASYYVTQEESVEDQQKGFKMVKDLAEHGHADGMCLYALLLNQGKIEGVDANPNLAVAWWRRCVDLHRHISAMYELANAYYLGEGVAENLKLSIRMFYRAANLGHPGAAYMLGECMLDGVGLPRDRANALEWLVTSAELGHHLARQRVMAILNEDYDHLDAGDALKERDKEEVLKWINSRDQLKRAVNIERRYTIGGGSRNPEVLKRRITKVQESRDTV